MELSEFGYQLLKVVAFGVIVYFAAELCNAIESPSGRIIIGIISVIIIWRLFI